MSAYSQIFARRLRAEREAAGLTQVDLARLMGKRLGFAIDTSAVSRIETVGSGRVIKLDEAAAAAEALGIPLTLMLVEVTDQIEAQIDELRRDLDLALDAAARAESEFAQAQDAIQGIRRRIAELQVARDAEGR